MTRGINKRRIIILAGWIFCVIADRYLGLNAMPDAAIPAPTICFLPLIAAAISVAGSVASTVAANNRLRKAEKKIDSKQERLDNWYRSEMATNALDRADAQAALRRVRENMREAMKSAETDSIKRGMTDEAKVAQAARTATVHERHERYRRYAHQPADGHLGSTGDGQCDFKCRRCPCERIIGNRRHKCESSEHGITGCDCTAKYRKRRSILSRNAIAVARHVALENNAIMTPEIKKEEPVMIRDAQGRLVINTAASDTAGTATEQQQPGTTKTATEQQPQPEAPANPQPTSSTVFEGLSRTLAQRRQAATTRRDEAAKRWQDRIAESGSAAMALARSMKPASTADEEKRLRMLAIGQALGELVGAGISGGIAFSKRGQGYVQPGTGLAWQTLDRLNKLKVQGVAADREYSTRMNNILSGIAEAKSNQARHEYDMSEAELRRLDALDDYVARQGAIGARQEKLQTLKHNNNMEEIDLKNTKNNNKTGKSGSEKNGKESIPNDIDIIVNAIRDTDKIIITDTYRGKQTKTEPYTKYSKQEERALIATSYKILPIYEKHNLTIRDIKYLNELTKKHSISWEKISDLLDAGVKVGDINDFITENKNKFN